MTIGNSSAPGRRHGKIHAVIDWLKATVSACWAWRRFPIVWLFCGGLVLWLTWYIPPWFPTWHTVLSRLFAEHLLFAVTLSVSLGLLLFWLLLWKLPQRQVRYVFDVKDRVDSESKARQTMAQIVGGAVLLGGLYFTALTLRTSQETLRVNQETLRTTQEGQITDRFTKAIEQLGDKERLMVCLGGIYALERIAKDSESDHGAVMEVLTAFVREQAPAQTMSPEKTSGERETKESQRERKLPSDIQAILTVIGRRTRTLGNGEMRPLALSDTNLQGAHLEGAQLQRAHLDGAQLQGAYLAGAQLQGAHLRRTKNLTQEQINRACIDENTQLPEGLARPDPCPIPQPTN
jgi:hypothetical protein